MSQTTKDLHDLVMHIMKKWYFFLIAGFVFTTAGIFYYLISEPKFNTSLVYSMRTNEQGRMFYSLDAATHHAIITGGQDISKVDEQERVNSHTIMREVILENGLQTEVRKKEDLRYMGIYPCNEVSVDFLDMDIQEVAQIIVVEVKKEGTNYAVKAKYGRKRAKKTTLHSAEETFTLNACGQLRIVDNGMEEGEKYRIIIYPINVLADMLCTDVKSDRVSDDNYIMEITCKSDMPARAEKIMEEMISIYNRKFIEEKEHLATKTMDFLDLRIQEVLGEIEAIEKDNTLARDKRDLLLQGKHEDLRHLITRRGDVGFARVYSIDPISIIDHAFTEAVPASPKPIILCLIIFLLTLCTPLLIFYCQAILTAERE